MQVLLLGLKFPGPLCSHGNLTAPRPVLQGLGQMWPADCLTTLEVRQCPRHFQQPVRCPQRQGQPFAGPFQPSLVRRRQSAMATQPVEVEKRIHAPLAALLYLPRLRYPGCHIGTGFTTGLIVQRGAFASHGQVQVDAVQQRP